MTGATIFQSHNSQNQKSIANEKHQSNADRCLAVDENGNVIVPGCVRNGIDAESANKIFDEMSEFAKYAFNKSHAACYAVVAYRTAYLKSYYPAEFMASMLNSF